MSEKQTNTGVVDVQDQIWILTVSPALSKSATPSTD